FCHISSLLSCFILYITPLPPRSTLFPYTTLFRSLKPEISTNTEIGALYDNRRGFNASVTAFRNKIKDKIVSNGDCNTNPIPTCRSEEHTSELQSRENLVCRLLLEKKKKKMKK